MLHRIRDRLVPEQTGTIKAIRGHMAEFGIVAARRGLGMKELLAIISGIDDARLPSMAREVPKLSLPSPKLPHLTRNSRHHALFPSPWHPSLPLSLRTLEVPNRC